MLPRPCLRRLRPAPWLAVLPALLWGAPAAAQLSLARTWEGPYDYVVAGATLRNSSNGGNPCSVNNSATATVSGIPAGATVRAAYLYWAASGSSVDATVRFDGVNYTADRTATATYSLGGSNFSYFGGFEDITGRITGNDSFTFTNLSVATGNPWCNSSAVTAGFAVVVIFESAGTTPVRRIEVRDGLRALRFATETVALGNFLGASAPDARFHMLAYEGDPDQPGTAADPEEVRFNGTLLSDGLNPPDNPFNSTNGPAGNTTSYGLDLDGGNVSPLLAPGARSANLALTAGTDLVVMQMIVTSVAVVLVDVTPNGLAAPVQRLPGTRYSQLFAVENPSVATDNFDLLARAIGTSPFTQIDSITGPGITTRVRPDSARVQLAAATTTSYTVWYTVPVGAPADDVVRLVARSQSRPTLAVDDGWAELRRVVPALTLTKSVSPQNTLSPGTELTYTMAVSNAGEYAARGVMVTDAVPVQVAFKVASMAQTLPGGLTATPQYSADDGTTWTYTPVSAGCGVPAGFDGCVKRVRWVLSGDLPAGAASSGGSFTFVARIR